jgi:hypothetical protein
VSPSTDCETDILFFVKVFECQATFYDYEAQVEIMKITTVGTFSGCVLWILSIGVLSSTMLPIFFLVGNS